MLRFGRRHPAPQMPFSGRYLTRLFILSGFCVFGMVALNLPHLNEMTRARTGAGKSGGIAQGGVQTVVAPSPFGELGIGVIVADGRPKQPVEISQDLSNEPAAPPGELAPVDQRLLQNVLDKTDDLAKRPYYHLATLAAQASTVLLEKHARRDVAFAHLWDDPEKYRGELVYLEGHLRGLKPLKVTENEYFNPAKIENLYEGYLLNEDSHPNPYVIIMPKVAKGMPIGSNITENITFAGYFLKLYRYKAADHTERAAPLLIGQMLTWTPAPVHDTSTRLSTYLAAAFVLLIMGVGGAIWTLNRRTLRFSPASGAMNPDTGGPAIEDLAQLEKLDISEPPQAFEGADD